jgi:tRNA(Ile2) C34 agmatinyltransferase TiaS
MQLTARQAYIDILTELVKEEAPTLYLEDYLYYFNKAISEYMKTRYEVFETNQQLADDMRSWKKSFQASSLETPSAVYTKVYRAQKIDEYRHLLSCIIDVAISRPITKCDQRPGQLLPIKSLECRQKQDY